MTFLHNITSDPGSVFAEIMGALRMVFAGVSADSVMARRNPRLGGHNRHAPWLLDQGELLGVEHSLSTNICFYACPDLRHLRAISVAQTASSRVR